MWLVGNNRLFFRTANRDFTLLDSLKGPSLNPNEWHYVGATYDYTSGICILWLNGLEVDNKYIGRNEIVLSQALCE